MDDERILELYWRRDETALAASEEAYGAYCLRIAQNILGDTEDAKESVNDVWLAAWKTIPPHRPQVLQTYFGKLARHISLKKRRDNRAAKRGGGEMPLIYDELADCIPSPSSVEREAETAALAECIDRFLNDLPSVEQAVFLRRYWYFESIHAIAAHLHFSDSKVKSMLHRTRKKLAVALQKEGFRYE